jgi:predicted TIM-barrel fold metal-dependent hydrolase
MPATVEQLQQFETSIAVEHVCVTHGLSYGDDCTSLLHYLDHFKGKARGICVLDIETVTDDLLNIYHTAGVRSVRLDLIRSEATCGLDKQIALIESTAKRLVRWGKGRWSIQIQQPHIEFWGRLKGKAAIFPVPLVVDHFALIEGQSMRKEDAMPPVESEGFAELLGAL